MLLGAGTTAVVVGETETKLRDSVWGDTGLGTLGAGRMGSSCCSFWGLTTGDTGDVLELGVIGDCATSVLLLTNSGGLKRRIILNK